MTADLNPEDWVEESADLARRAVYTETIGDGNGPFTLNETYQAAARKLARAQSRWPGRGLRACSTRRLAARDKAKTE